jgi:hypothetical protein
MVANQQPIELNAYQALGNLSAAMDGFHPSQLGGET